MNLNVKAEGPRPARLSREESRALTRTRLVQAAAELFAERGFYGASVEDIASRAGYTRGAFYSNFADKEDVFLAVLDERTDRQIAEVTDLFKSAGSPDELFVALRQRHSATPEDPAWLALALEFKLHALRDPSVRPRLAQRERSIRDAFGRAISAQLKALGIKLPAPLHQLGSVLQALDSGLAVQHRIDPEEVSDELYFDVLALLLRAASALDEVSGPVVHHRGPRATRTRSRK